MASKNSDIVPARKTVAHRLKSWRKNVARVSLRELREAVNQHLVGDDQVSVSTVNNYEVPGREPRASYLVALKRAFPELNLDWLLFGEGEPSISKQEAAKSRQQRALKALGTLAQKRLQDVQRFGQLPLSARDALLSFFSDVRLSGPPYLEQLAKPEPLPFFSAAEAEEGTAFADFIAAVDKILFAPFEATEHFVSVEGLSEEEATGYTLTLVAALRPLVRSLRLPSQVRSSLEQQQT